MDRKGRLPIAALVSAPRRSAVVLAAVPCSTTDSSRGAVAEGQSSRVWCRARLYRMTS